MFNIFKGWIGEKVAQFGMWSGLDGQVYRRLHNVIIPAKGGTTQIDHVLVSVFGVFVVETKNMDGWIFGDEKAPKWTQCIYGKKYPFQNPLHQNYRHTQALAEHLGKPPEIFHSVVFFIGDCEFKTPMPANVLERGICRYIQSFTREVLSTSEVKSVLLDLQRAKLMPVATGKAHVAGLKERHGGDACPKCGEALVLRTAKKGANQGGQFYGCSGFPKCRYVRSVG